jgi:hypothetical protein
MVSLIAAVLALQGASTSAQPTVCDGVVIRQQAPVSVTEGDELSYEIEVHNVDDCELGPVEILDFLPYGIDIRQVTPPSAGNPGTDSPPEWIAKLRWEWPKIPPGGSVSMRIAGLVPQGTRGWLRNTVCVSSPQILRKCHVLETKVARIGLLG